MTRTGLSILAMVFATIGAVPVAADTPSIQAQFEAKIADTKASMMSDPEVALVAARRAGTLAKSMPGDKAAIAKATSEWLEGEALTRLNHPDQASPIVAEALATVAARQPKSKLYGDLLKSSAAIASKTGKVQDALPMLHKAFAIYQQLGETRAQAIILQNIGSLYYDARDYNSVLRYYDQANAIYKDDPALTVSSHNNRGNALKEMGRFAEAEHEYKIAMKNAAEMDSPFLEVQILSNIALAQFLDKKFDKASQTVAIGLARANVSAPEWRPYLWGTGAQIAFAQGNVVRAEQLVRQTFAGVDLENSSMPYRDYHETASRIYSALNQSDKALIHLKAFKRLDDNGRELAASTNAALMSARFDAANQQVRISRLESQQVQRDLVIAQSQNRLRGIVQVTVFGGVAVALVMVAMMFAFAASRRRRREVSAANVQLTHAANHDLLTGLANRSYFRQLVENALSEAIEAGQRCAILLVDLDHFKWVNDTLGHNAGDEVLCQVAQCLKEVAGTSAHAVRLGGDEFAVVVPCVGSDDDLIKLGDDIVAKLSVSRNIEGTVTNVGATVGVAIGPDDGHTVKMLTRSADLALYHGKSAGRRRSIRYAKSMQVEVDDRRSLERDLRQALEKDQLSIAYQSIVDAGSETIIGYEALLRWQHPTRGEISPATFVPIAEEIGLINQIGDWVLHSACAEAANWPEHIDLAVNLSALQVEGSGLTNSLVNALASSGLAPSRLELEVTESVFLRQDNKTDAMLERLRMIGVRLALDDFGTGYSSLGYLRRATFSTIKIDRSFVKSATQDSKDSLAIVKAIVALATDLGMKTTAEGIETEKELEKMRDLGCTQLQGYLFSKPSSSPSADKANGWPTPNRLRPAA
jgi:diguanylate cyclase (GGDEF)-like protein